MIGRYDWAGGSEAMVRFGPPEGPVVVAALPLFEEANRTRTFMVTILRALADRGIASVLPDVPGQGESMVPTEQATLAAMRDALAAVPGRYSFAIRSGALLDTAARKGRWHLSPQQGPELLRELARMRVAGGSDDFGGNCLSPALLAELEQAETGPAFVARLETEARPADAKLAGSPLWRRAEPDNDIGLADRIAGQLAAWIRACEG